MVFAPTASTFAPLAGAGGTATAVAVAPAAPVSVTRPAGQEVNPPLPIRALVLTLAAIGVGAVMMGISYLLGENHDIAPATYLRYAIALTLALYAVVGVLVVTQITPSVRLRWHDGKPALAVATGLLVGGGLSTLLLLAMSAAAGHLDPDPRIVLLMSEGDAPHVIATVLITCAAAPLIEEVLFRGLLLESQRGRGTRVAIWISALAFAVWHLNPSALRYYALMGALLGWLYTRRGLACSIAAHVGFNGVLTLAALSLVLSPGSSVSVRGLDVHLPSGWRAAAASELPVDLAASGGVAGFRGPSGAELVIVSFDTPAGLTVEEIYDRLSVGGFGAPGHGALHELRLPAGPAVEVEQKLQGDDGTVVFLPHTGHSYELALRGAGSVKARNDFERILKSLQVSRPDAG
jgi:membrane protease YdiL (CAAX protease family)